MEIGSDAFHVVKAEGEKHSLLIKQMRPSNAGSYRVTAVNPAGAASCGATLYIQSGETAAPPYKGDLRAFCSRSNTFTSINGRR